MGVAALAAASLAPAHVGRIANLGFSNGVTPAFKASVTGCINQYAALGGLAAQIVRTDEASLTPIAVQPPSAGHESFALLAHYKPTGQVVIKVEWAQEHGTYQLDDAPEVPCAILLHELRHAMDFDANRISGGQTELKPAVVRNPAGLRQALYTEGLAVQAENFYLWHHSLRQRRHYGLFRLTSCVPHPRSKGSIYLQGCFGTFILPSWVVWPH